MILRIFTGMLFILAALPAARSQTVDSVITRAVAAAVQLDSVVITATRAGFDVEDFIRLVQRDQSLYRAFQNIRFASHTFHTEMQFTGKRDKVKAAYRSSNRQAVVGNCRTMEVIEEEASPGFYKRRKNKYKFYTAQLYDRVFVTHGRVCGQMQDSLVIDNEDTSKITSHIGELKKLIFAPGSRSNVPLIGKKTEVFSERMLPYYNFNIRSDQFAGQPVYVFEASVKEDFEDRGGKTVFRELVTYFSKEDFQVLARRYHLAHSNALYKFDVRMAVDLARISGRYYPTRVAYDGLWNVPGKRKEIGTFTVELKDFRR